jgi:hypothetical protein
MSVKIELSKGEYKDLIDYCQLNKIDIDILSKKCFSEGFRIEKYGLLNSNSKVVEKEIIVEKPIEIIREVPVEVIKEIIVEKPIEVIKEIPVEIVKEVIIEKPVEVIKEVQLPPVEVEVIKYVDREIIKEVIIEKPVANFDNICDNTYIEELETKIKILESKPTEVKEIITEVIKEVPVEVVKEVIKEVPVEVVKEIIIEKEDSNMKTKMESLQQTLMKLREENMKKDQEIEENKKLISDLKRLTEEKKAVFLRGSDLNKLY